MELADPVQSGQSGAAEAGTVPIAIMVILLEEDLKHPAMQTSRKALMIGQYRFNRWVMVQTK